MAKPHELPVFNGSVQHDQFKDLADLREFVQRFIEAWDGDREHGIEIKIAFAQGSGPAIWSLANHSVELARSILLLSEQDRLVVAAPLIRLLLENMITGIWLYLSPERAVGLVHEGLRNRVAAIREVVAHGSAGFSQETLAEWAGYLDEFEANASLEGRYFEKRCNALVDGPAIYTTWRIASSLSHAGMAMIDFYLMEAERSDENPLGVSLNPGARLPSHEAWLGTAACALLASIKSYDLISAEGRLGTQIEEGAKRLGVGLEFRLASE